MGGNGPRPRTRTDRLTPPPPRTRTNALTPPLPPAHTNAQPTPPPPPCTAAKRTTLPTHESSLAVAPRVLVARNAHHGPPTTASTQKGLDASTSGHAWPPAHASKAWAPHFSRGAACTRAPRSTRGAVPLNLRPTLSSNLGPLASLKGYLGPSWPPQAVFRAPAPLGSWPLLGPSTLGGGGPSLAPPGPWPLTP